MNIDQLRETALVNFELLLDHWNIKYRKILPNEYDILATWRNDNSFGSVRFNTEKGRGADFAGSYLTEQDYASLGPGFNKSDFTGFSNGQQASTGFDILGLCQRIFNRNTQLEAKKQLEASIAQVSQDPNLKFATAEAAERRKKEQREKQKKLVSFARDLWESCRVHKIKGSVGEMYLNKRGIKELDPNIRFHPGITYTPTQTKYPALIFKVQILPDGPLIAIHRIYLDNSGNKAKIPNPKMALAPIKGGAIWFGDPYPILAIAEGPENALIVKEQGFPFVASSIFGTNFHNLTIPRCVKKIYLIPDVDRAGLESLERAKLVYSEKGIQVNPIIIPTKIINGKVADVNDLVQNGDIDNLLEGM